MSRLCEGRVAIVTGAGRGLGREHALMLAAHGAKVVVNDIGASLDGLAKDGSPANEVVEEIRKGGGEAVTNGDDVSDWKGAKKMIDHAIGTFGRLDVLINNAGILLDEDQDALTITPEIFETTLRTNTLGPWLVAQAFVPLLKKSREPRIVNVSSGGGQLDGGADGWAPGYCVSKTALNGVTIQLTAALPKFAVNSVCPGWVRTDMGGENADRSVAEGAATIVWLATDAPHDLTGKFVKDRKVIPW